MEPNTHVEQRREDGVWLRYFTDLLPRRRRMPLLKCKLDRVSFGVDHPIHPYPLRRHIVILYRRLSGGSSSRLPLAHVRVTGRPTKRAGITPKIRAFDVTVSDMRSSIFKFTRIYRSSN